MATVVVDPGAEDIPPIGDEEGDLYTVLEPPGDDEPLVVEIVETNTTGAIIISEEEIPNVLLNGSVYETPHISIYVPGEPGTPGLAGPQNLFVQQTQPVMNIPGVWFETNPDETVHTIWVGTTT